MDPNLAFASSRPYRYGEAWNALSICGLPTPSWNVLRSQNFLFFIDSNVDRRWLSDSVAVNL